MRPQLKGVAVAMLGGDARQVILAERLEALGVRVKAVGVPFPEKRCRGIEICREISEGLEGVQAVILPVPGVNDRGELYTVLPDRPLILSGELLSCLPAGTPVLVGMARKVLREMTGRCNLRLIELMGLDEVAILNSIPSAEGAVQMAMENSSITIHGSSSLVLGFGRTAITLARLLAAMGSRTTVVARNPAHRARAVEMGLGAADYTQLGDAAAKADFLYNTVPAMVLDKEALSRVSPEALIIDLASPPGGTDFEEAQRLGIKAILAPGLPGKVAPKTAGRILADVVPRILAEELTLR
ncbi:MAG: dipicolinate synthase [Peptococcaceae bacterium BRH_c4a]|nr:MAG: dipicolinate synthase [Peptococcaceae bacterium BRH_c4a]